MRKYDSRTNKTQNIVTRTVNVCDHSDGSIVKIKDTHLIGTLISLSNPGPSTWRVQLVSRISTGLVKLIVTSSGLPTLGVVSVTCSIIYLFQSLPFNHNLF